MFGVNAVRILILAIMIVASSCNRLPKSDRVIGRIGSYELTESHFSSAFEIVYRRTGSAMPINSISKQSIFDREFNVFVLAVHAEETGLDKDAEAELTKGIMQRQILMGEFIKQQVLDSLKTDEKLSRELFRRSKTFLRASHLYFETKEEADSAFSLLTSQKESFENIAARTFKTRYLAKNGGDIGLFTLDDMDMAFEEVAYRLKVGELSRPIKTAYGYNIIKLTGHFPEPLITEYQYQNAKPVYDQIADRRQKMMAEDLHIDEVVGQYRIDNSKSDWLWEQFEKNNGFVGNDEITEGLVKGSLGDTSAEFATDGINRVSVGQILTELYFTPAQSRQKISNRRKFDEMIRGLLYRNHICTRARELKLDKSEKFQTELKYSFANYLHNKVENALTEMVEVPQDELLSLYDLRKDGLNTQEKLHLSRIIVRSADEAKMVRTKILSGMPFEDAVKKYSIDSEYYIYEGDMGFVSAKDLGTIATKLKNLKVNDVSDPIEYQGDRFHLYKLNFREPSRPLTFDEAVSSLADEMKSKIVEKRKSTLITEVKLRHGAFVDSEYLNKMDMKL